MSALDKNLRNALEKTVKSARGVAEDAARAALEQIGVGEAAPPAYLDEPSRALRRRLRAHGRQLGDALNGGKVQTIGHLVQEVAYQHWHRMLFARFLADNNLLMYDGVAVTLPECDELAPDEDAKSGWELAGKLAARMLPQIFRPDAPVYALSLPQEHQHKLEMLVANLPQAAFMAADSLGWVYQFWQANNKDQINKSGVKIGADELPAVTQLFTEDYMVDFLLDNTLGAWWAGKVLAANPKQAATAQSEDDLRHAVALPGCPWNYLRFIRASTPSPLAGDGPHNTPSPLVGEGRGEGGNWTPAAGTFAGWPQTAAELKCLDPCMGSGHFVVAMFERLVALRMAEEGLDDSAAVAAVIRDNLFGLELDPRCTQIAAFNLALAAWRRVGHCALPVMNLACSGIAPNTREADWLAIAGDDEMLQRGMERLYRLFQQAAVLGSLINPRAGEGDLLEAGFHELQPLLEQALAREVQDDTAHEMAVTVRGLAKAAEILAGQFTLVATNVPYLGRGSPFKVSLGVRPGTREQLCGRDMRFTLELGAWCRRLLRPARGLQQFTQIHVFRQYEQVPRQLLRAGVREGRPLGLGHGDIQTGHRRGDFPREIVLRYRAINVKQGMCRAERGHHHGIDIERHQRQAKAKQRRLRITQGLDFGVEIFFQFLKGRFDTPSCPIQAGNGDGIGRR
jgi:hypothetical protein